LGATAAGFILPQYSEIKGRKEAIHLSNVIAGVSIILAGLSSNIYQFMFFLFLTGVGLNGFETLSLVYVTEISGK
jgi:MFS family permease